MATQLSLAGFYRLKERKEQQMDRQTDRQERKKKCKRRLEIMRDIGIFCFFPL